MCAWAGGQGPILGEAGPAHDARRQHIVVVVVVAKQLLGDVGRQEDVVGIETEPGVGGASTPMTLPRSWAAIPARVPTMTGVT